MSIKKRTTSLLLALVMALALLPAHAWATENVDEPDTAEIPQVQAAAEAVTSGTCGAAGSENSVTWSLDSGVLTISGNGPMADWDGSIDKPWGDYWKVITSVVVEEGVTSVGDRAFMNYEALTSVKLPESLTRIGDNAFYYCKKLAKISIPQNVIHIGSGAFASCKITSVTIPDGVTEIKDYTFDFCEELTDLTLSKNLKRIGKSAFNYCSALTQLSLPTGVETLDDNAFSNCLSLPSVTIPASVTSIGAHAFDFCKSMTAVTLSEGIKTIGKGAFEACLKLTDVTIPASVTSIEEGAFMSCKALTNIMVANGNANYTVENGVLFTKDKTALLAYPSTKSEEAYVIPNTVTRIGESAFWSSGLQTIIFPDGLKSIGKTAFEGCGKLTEVILPDSVTDLGWGAFSSCSSMQKVKLSESLTVLEESVFAACGGITYVQVPRGVTGIKARAFAGCGKLAGVELPAHLTYIEEEAFQNCSKLQLVTYNNTKANWEKVTIGSDNEYLENSYFIYSEYAPGCPTGGSTVRIQDVAFVYDFLTGQKQDEAAVEKDSAQWRAMNVNNDDAVDVYDLQAIYEMAVGLRS